MSRAKFWPTVLLWMLLAGGGVVCPAAGEPEEAVSDSVADQRIRATLLQELNRLADEGVTRRAAELLDSPPLRARTPLVLPEPGAERLGGVDLYRRLREGAVIVGLRYKCKKCTNWHLNAASGFFLTRDGVVATNHHVLALEGGDAVAVMDGAGRVHAVREVVADDPTHDIVLLRVAGEGFSALPLARGATPAGTEVAVMSHPDGRFWMFTTGVVSRVADWTDVRREGKPTYEVLCITAPFAPGSSGGAVADLSGNVVGIATRIMPILQAKEHQGQKDKEHAHTGEYTAMVIPMAVPASRVVDLTR